MSYTLFLLLNVNHDPGDLLAHIAEKLEPNGDSAFCLDNAPDEFFTAEYLSEGTDRSICIDIPFGAEESVLRSVLDFVAHVEERIQVQVLDPQIGNVLNSSEANRILDRWKALNIQALESYADGHHFLRNVEMRDGRKVMIEAIRFQEETWQNYCSVALAFNRVGHAAEARKLFERALQLDPENAGIQYALGVSCYNLRDYDRCRQYLLSSLASEPDNPGAQELLQDCNLKLQGSPS